MNLRGRQIPLVCKFYEGLHLFCILGFYSKKRQVGEEIPPRKLLQSILKSPRSCIQNLVVQIQVPREIGKWKRPTQCTCTCLIGLPGPKFSEFISVIKSPGALKDRARTDDCHFMRLFYYKSFLTAPQTKLQSPKQAARSYCIQILRAGKIFTELLWLGGRKPERKFDGYLPKSLLVQSLIGIFYVYI